MAIAVDQNYDKAQRKISTNNLAQFAGVDCQLLVEKETHRPIIMDGSTIGGKFKCASTDELKAVETVANNAISQAYADEHYLGITAKAESAKIADTATKATQDASGNVITNTYATKTELSGKLGKTEKASSANIADAVAWAGVSDKPNFATVATSGSYNDLKDKPNISNSTVSEVFNSEFTGGTVTITGLTPYKPCFLLLRKFSSSGEDTSVSLNLIGGAIVNSSMGGTQLHKMISSISFKGGGIIIGSIVIVPVETTLSFSGQVKGKAQFIAYQ